MFSGGVRETGKITSRELFPGEVSRVWPKGILCLPKELDVTVQGVGTSPPSKQCRSEDSCHCKGGRWIDWKDEMTRGTVTVF